MSALPPEPYRPTLTDREWRDLQRLAGIAADRALSDTGQTALARLVNRIARRSERNAR